MRDAKALPERPQQDYSCWFLIAILALAAVLRFQQLGAIPHGLHPDEAMDGSSALEVLETGRPQLFYSENNGREGLYVNLAAVSIELFGNSEFALRLPAALFGLATVWGAYCLAAELWSAPIGLLSAFFLATSFWHLNFSRLGLRVIAAPAFLVWALYLLVLGLRRAAAGKPSANLLVLAGVLYGLGFHTYIAYRVTPVLVAGFLVWLWFQARPSRNWPRFWKPAVLFAAAAALVAAPLFLYFAAHPGTLSGRASQVAVHSAGEVLSNTWKTALMFFAGDPNWRHNYDGQGELFWPVAILFVLGIGLAIRSRSIPGLLALLWIALGALPTIFSDSAPHALRALPMIPAVCVVAALGAEWSYAFLKRTFGARPALAVAAIFFVIAVWQPYHTYFDLWARNPNVPRNFTANLVDAAHQVRSLGGPTYIAATYTGDTAKGIPVLLLPFVYLTGSYTASQQAATNIHYLTPDNFQPPAGVQGKTFCDQAKAALPQARVICVNLRSGQ